MDREAKKTDEASLWNEDKDVSDVVRPAHVQTGDRLSPESVPRDMSFSKPESRILAIVEAVQAAKLHHDHPSSRRPCSVQVVPDGTHACAVENGCSAEARCAARRWTTRHVFPARR